MTQWNIAYTYNNNTEVLTVQAEQAPELDQAVDALLEHARRTYEVKRPATDAQQERTSAVQLAECFGITLTGITRAD